MDLAISPRAEELRGQLQDFIDTGAYGLWNFFMPNVTWGTGLSNVDCAHCASSWLETFVQ
jgi:hypothetical protein